MLQRPPCTVMTCFWVQQFFEGNLFLRQSCPSLSVNSVPSSVALFLNNFRNGPNIKCKVICVVQATHFTKPLFTELLFVITM